MVVNALSRKSGKALNRENGALNRTNETRRKFSGANIFLATAFATIISGTGLAVLGVGLAASAVAQEAATTAKPAAATERAYKWKTPKLSRAQIDGLLATPDKIVIIDVRRPDELTKIGGFPVYLSIQAADLEKSLAFIPKDRSVITASNHAGRAGAAGDLLTSKGFKVAGAAGVQNYEEEGGKLTKIEVPNAKPVAAAN